MTLHELNTMPDAKRSAELLKCCGSNAWVARMQQGFPANDLVELLNNAKEQWYRCGEQDWLEAFNHHPKIGDVESLKKKFAATAQWASGEQAAVAAADTLTIEALAKGNDAYERKFGFIFIVCATGKSAVEMLQLLQQRLTNSPAEELETAMEEQQKITQLRLQKLLA